MVKTAGKDAKHAKVKLAKANARVAVAEARMKEHQALDKEREAAAAAAKAKEATDAAEITAKEVIAAEEKAEKAERAAEAQSNKTQENADRQKALEKPKRMHQHPTDPQVETLGDAGTDSLANPGNNEAVKTKESKKITQRKVPDLQTLDE